MTDQGQFAEALALYTPEARDILAGLTERGGVLESGAVGALADTLGVGLPQLLISLLPVAAAFSRPLISNYRVGAVASTPPTDAGWGHIYLGGNLEFAGEALGLTIHAEQAVTLNARFGGEPAIATLAVSSLPCGHCRQFLNEISDPPVVFTPAIGHAAIIRHSMEELLPAAFGPSDLGVEPGLLAGNRAVITIDPPADSGWVEPARPGSDSASIDKAPREGPDPTLVEEALRAAEWSYAPYTGSYAGCAIRTELGTVHSGSYVENAAFNPSVLAFQCALLHLHLKGAGLDGAQISEVALVEVDGPTTQLGATRRLLEAVAPKATFSYHRGGAG